MTFYIKMGFWVILCNVFLPETDLTLLVCVACGQRAGETGHRSRDLSSVFLLSFYLSVKVFHSPKNPPSTSGSATKYWLRNLPLKLAALAHTEAWQGALQGTVKPLKA